MRDVLRTPPGAPALLIHMATRTAFAAKLTISPNAVTALVTGLSTLPGIRSYAHTLCPALLKGDHNDLIVEKCTELGAERIYFWAAERSVVRLDSRRRQERERRLSAIGEAAAKQSKRTSIPEVKIANSLDEVLSCTQSLHLKPYIGSLGTNALLLRDLTPIPTACFLTGPEGDFSPKERELLTAHIATEVSLGPFTLRAETSAVAMVAGVNAAWGWDHHT